MNPDPLLRPHKIATNRFPCRRLGLGPLLLALALAGGVFAQAGPAEWPGRLMFSVLGPDQGLPSGMVIGIAQDTEGFLWFGTENGLCRYEGGHARRFTREDGLPSSYIDGLVPAPEGGLWVATNRGLVRFREGRFETPDFGPGIDGRTHFRVARDGRGRVWAANRQGVFVQKAGLQFERLPLPPLGEIGVLTYGTQSGRMYLAWSGGLLAVSPEGATQAWSTAEGLPPGGPHLVAEDGQGRIWAGASRTLVVKDPNSPRFADCSSRLDRSLSPNAAAFVDTDGSVWLPTQQGALHLVGDRFEALDPSTGLPFRWVRRLFRDREGTLWLMGAEVAHMLGGNRVWHYARSGQEAGGIVWSIVRAADGRLLVGTDDGAARLEKDGLVRIPGTQGRRIKSMAQALDGTLWLTSTIGPALWLKPGSNRAELAPLGELGSSINLVRRDSRGRLWIGHASHGLLQWDPETAQLQQEIAAGPSHLGVFDIREDALGRLWAATTAGLQVRGANGRWLQFTEAGGLLAHSLLCLALLPDGTAWIAYQEPSGLTRVRVEGARLQVIEHRTVKTGLPSNAIYALQVDSRSQLWMSSDQGLDRLDPPRHLGRHQGMPGEDCALHALLLERERVWVGTSGGLVRFESGPGADLEPPPKAHLLQAEFGPRRLDPPFGQVAPVPHRDATGEFRFAAPNYEGEQELRFQVRLLGLEDRWREVEGRSARWPLLPGGNYRFEVRAARGGGPFGESAGLDFQVRPPWWKTWWAYAIEVTALAGAVVAFLRLRLASLARSKAALELQVASRTEELVARNAELSSALGRVRQLSGLLPICACCKKIRDDKGYWNQLEAYLTEHTEVGFSHGICPDCIPKLYPEVAARRAQNATSEPPQAE